MNIKEKILKELERLLRRLVGKIAQESQPVNPDKPDNQPQTQPIDEIINQEPEKPTSSTTIQYRSFGSPNCANCKEDPDTQIKDLKFSKSNLTYKWAKGSLRNWGISNDHDASALAIGGYHDGKEWKFAKFDWISTDRLSRGFENIYGGYNGFDGKAWDSAKSRGFFIMSKDGKKRTNILTV